MLSRALRHVVLLLLAAVVLFPFVWMVLASLKPPEEIYVEHIRWLPDRLYVLENFTRAFTKAPLAQYLLNGVIVTLAILRKTPMRAAFPPWAAAPPPRMKPPISATIH